MAVHGGFKHQCQFETGALPWQPENFPFELAIKLLELTLAVGAGCDCNCPVRMKMVNVIVWNECVERRIDRSRDPIFSKCRKRIIPDHLIFGLLSAIKLLQAFE